MDTSVVRTAALLLTEGSRSDAPLVTPGSRLDPRRVNTLRRSSGRAVSQRLLGRPATAVLLSGRGCKSRSAATHLRWSAQKRIEEVVSVDGVHPPGVVGAVTGAAEAE